MPIAVLGAEGVCLPIRLCIDALAAQLTHSGFFCSHGITSKAATDQNIGAIHGGMRRLSPRPRQALYVGDAGPRGVARIARCDPSESFNRSRARCMSRCRSQYEIAVIHAVHSNALAPFGHIVTFILIHEARETVFTVTIRITV